VRNQRTFFGVGFKTQATGANTGILPQLPIVAPQPGDAKKVDDARVITPQAQLIGVAEQKKLEKTVAITDKPIQDTKEYDYVFIGAGATGGAAVSDLMPLLDQAAELRKQGFSVLVLEGGKDKQVKQSEIPLEHAAASENPELSADPNRTGKGTGYWVKHFSDAEDGKKDNKANEKGEIWKPRGEGIGGSTRVNANVFVRVDDVDWDALALKTGDPSFRAKNMKPLLQELEKNEYRPLLKLLHNIGKNTGIESIQNLGGHGFDGKLETSRASPKLLLEDLQLARITVQTLWWSLTRLGTMGDKIKRLVSAFDPNDNLTQGTQGPLLMPTSITKEGKRNGARELLMDAKKEHENLTLQDGARVRNLIFDDKNKCTGVRYQDENGKDHVVNVKREAIVACGSLETPALLMRSGIGPKKEMEKLEKIGIEPRIILEGVGQKQGDRYEVGVVFRLKKPFDLLLNTTIPSKPSDAARQAWEKGMGGALASNGAAPCFEMKSDPSLPYPDLFVFGVPGDFRGYKPKYSEEAVADPNRMTFVVLHANKGESRGTLELDPNNPFGAPIINHHFHKERKEGDAKPVVFGVEKVRELVESQFKGLIESEIWPGSQVDTAEKLETEIMTKTWGHHPRGGAQMGHTADPNTVVDADFKVLGTTGLRVIDASMLPDNIGRFIVSGLYQIGKLAGKKIGKDALEGPRPAATQNLLALRASQKPENLSDAQKLTQETADAARTEGLISPTQHKRMTDGTASKADFDAAWAAIDTVLKGPEKGHIADDRHTIAHNLLQSIAYQIDLQSQFATKKETFIDQVDKLVWRG